MSINSKKLDRILRKGGPLAAAICSKVPKSMRHAHRRGSVPTLQWLRFYEDVADLRWYEWASGTENRRHARRIAGLSAFARKS